MSVKKRVVFKFDERSLVREDENFPVEDHSLHRPCSTSRLDDAIENAKRRAVEELNRLDWHEGDLRKWNIIERAIRSVIAEMSNSPGERPGAATHD